MVTTKNNTVHQANQTFAALAVAEHSQQVNEQSPKRFDSKISSLKKSSLPDTCDVLVFANGNELNVKVTEITPDEIKYYRCDIPKGPLHISRRSELFMIKYNNGAREMVQNKSADKPAKGALPKQNKITPDVVWVASLCCLIYFLSPIGLVLGIIGLEKIKRNPQKYKGKQVAILSILFSAMMILLFAMLMLVAFL
ncbi:MAG: DUF4190 domain-containing protein [Bacteroidia bacterium]|nr:DUF4190 domain-containing protein [Bacteroidia bacterium]